MVASPRWRVGAVEVVAVLESAAVFDADFIRRYVVPAATRENLARLPWLAPHWVDAQGDPLMVTQAFVVRSRGKVIVVDTCIGNDKVRRNPAFDRLQTRFLDDLAEAGHAPDDVDVVLCTHLHFDHVGWNTRWDGAGWRPTFPRARYLFARREMEHWRAEGPKHSYVMADSIQPVVDAGLVDLVESDHAVTDEVRLEAAPGHTPGHVVVRIRSGEAEAVIVGDALHHPCQVAHPEWTGPADTDQKMAHATRATLVRDAVERQVLVFGGHFAPPAAGRIAADDAGLRLVAEHGEPAPIG